MIIIGHGSCDDFFLLNLDAALIVLNDNVFLNIDFDETLLFQLC